MLADDVELLLPFQPVASGKAIVPEARVGDDVELNRFTLRFQPVAALVATVTLDVTETGEPGVREPKPKVELESVRVMVWLTVKLIVWDVEVET